MNLRLRALGSVLAAGMLLPAVGAGRAAEEPAKPGPAQREVIPVSDLAKLKSMLGKTVVIQGIVKRVTASRSEHRRVSFTQGDFILYIRKQDFDSSPDWKLDDLVGREIFAGGEVKDYRGQLELVLTKPAQIADAPERIDLGKPATTGTSTGSATAPGEPPGAAIRRETAAVRQWLAVTDAASQRLVTERFEISFEPGSRSGAPPLIIESYSGKERGPALGGLEAVRTKLDGWPRGKVCRVRRTEGTGPGLPHGLALALMLRSAFDGFELPARLLVAGDFAGAGSMIGGREELLLWNKAPPPPDACVLVPEGAEEAIFDQLLDGNWTVLTGAQIFAARDLDGAVRVARAIASNEWQPLMTRFAEAQKALAGATGASARVDSLLRNPQMRERLDEVRRGCPDHVNSRILIDAAQNKLRKTYSTAGTGLRLRQFYLKLSGELKLMREDSADGRRKMRTHVDGFDDLLPKCDSSWKRFADAIARQLEAVKDAPKFEEKNLTPRQKKAGEELKAATDAAKLEYEEAIKFKG